MAYQRKDVTSFALADIVSGSVYAVPVGSLESLTASSGKTLTPADLNTKTALGEIGEDSISVTPEADGNDKLTWDRNHGQVFSNYKNVINLAFASSTDPDVLGFILGTNNVTSSGGGVKAVFDLRNTGDVALVVFCRTDDGRKLAVCIDRGVVDPNIDEVTLTNTEITVFGVTITASGGDSFILAEVAEDDESI